MGKGRILNGGTDGLYQIEILEDRTGVDGPVSNAEGRELHANFDW